MTPLTKSLIHQTKLQTKHLHLLMRWLTFASIIVTGIFAIAGLGFDFVYGTSVGLYIFIGAGIFSAAVFSVSQIFALHMWSRSLRFLYGFSGILIIVGMYLSLVALGVSLVVLISSPLAVNLGKIAYPLVLVIVLLGHALTYRIKTRVIKLSGDTWPEPLKGRRIGYCSDLHLGIWYGPHFVKRLLQDVADSGVDLLLIGGDVLDGTHMDEKHIEEVFGHVDRSNCKIFAVTGNHDYYYDLETPKEALSYFGMDVIDRQTRVHGGLTIAGLPYKYGFEDGETFESALDELIESNGSPIDILMTHEPRNTDINYAKEKGIKMVLSGHTHAGQIWPFQYLARGFYHYFAYGMYKGGEDFIQYTSSGVGTWGPPVKINTRPEYVVFEF